MRTISAVAELPVQHCIATASLVGVFANQEGCHLTQKGIIIGT